MKMYLYMPPIALLNITMSMIPGNPLAVLNLTLGLICAVAGIGSLVCDVVDTLCARN
jgi:hypothetical protein